MLPVRSATHPLASRAGDVPPAGARGWACAQFTLNYPSLRNLSVWRYLCVSWCGLPAALRPKVGQTCQVSAWLGTARLGCIAREELGVARRLGGSMLKGDYYVLPDLIHMFPLT